MVQRAAQKGFRALLGLGLAVALTTSTASAWADASQAGAPATSHGQQRFQQRLGLSDEQMAAIKEVAARHADERKQLWQALRDARSELRQAALNGGDVKGKAAVLAGLVGQIAELRATTLQEIAPILNQEQRDAIAKMGPRLHRHRAPHPPQG
jgi:Spy/CpxP family protein refolding chaperone